MDDCAFDVTVTIRPLWITPEESLSSRMARAQAEQRFAMLGAEIAKVIRQHLDAMREDQGEDVQQWVFKGLLFPKEEGRR